MRRLLFVHLLLVGSVIALGFYRGWFSFQTTYDPEAGREGVQLEIDRNRIQPDIRKVREKFSGGDTQLSRSLKDSTRDQPRRIPPASADGVPRRRRARPPVTWTSQSCASACPPWMLSGAAD
jgi:hypothetical protein